MDRRRKTSWHLVVGGDLLQALTMERSGEMLLPVFSFREEAELFAKIESGTSWLTWELTNEELLLMLRKLSGIVARVCLDPLPLVAGGEMLELVSLKRERFEELLSVGRFGCCAPLLEEQA